MPHSKEDNNNQKNAELETEQLIDASNGYPNAQQPGGGATADSAAAAAAMANYQAAAAAAAAAAGVNPELANILQVLLQCAFLFSKRCTRPCPTIMVECQCQCTVQEYTSITLNFSIEWASIRRPWRRNRSTSMPNSIIVS